MRCPILLLIFSLLTCASAHAKLYIQKDSRSPDGSVVFAINYPPEEKRPDTWAQTHPPMLEGCFVHPKTGERIGNFFYLEGTSAEDDHPGSYSFDAYHVFDYVWSADSTHVAIVQHTRHSGLIYPFRRKDVTFERLRIPDLDALFRKQLVVAALHESSDTSISANRWLPNQCLVVTIARFIQVADSGLPPGKTWNEKDWERHSLQLTLAFDAVGKPAIKATQYSYTLCDSHPLAKP